MIDHSFTRYAGDWAGPISSIILGITMLDPHAWLIAKETVVIVSILIGLVTNGIRLYKEWKSKDEDKE